MDGVVVASSRPPASLLAVANLVVAEADTTAGSITFFLIGGTRRTTDLTVGALRPIGLEQEFCPFRLRDREVATLVDSRSLPLFPFCFHYANHFA